jgi:hypothetical protein
MEWIKHVSDQFIIWLLKISSSFARELTQAGRAEQRLWREQRLRNLKGLAIRSKERYAAQAANTKRAEVS